MFVGLSNGMKMTSNLVFLFPFQYMVVRHFKCELHFLDKFTCFIGKPFIKCLFYSTTLKQGSECVEMTACRSLL